eukprot:c9523_g1_i1 orf=130-912(+)
MTSLDMALDEIIERNKHAEGGGRGRARGRRGRGGLPPFRRGLFLGGGSRGALRVRRGPLNRPLPFQLAKSFLRRGPSNSGWRRELLGEVVGTAVRSLGIETGTKLYLSNLDYGVSNEDIKELFLEVGDLKRCGIHYDRSGRSKGTAEVVYSRRQDALIALKRYNNVLLDGKPMKIELIGTNLMPSLSRVMTGPPTLGRGRRSIMTSGGRGRGRAFGPRRFRGGRGQGRRAAMTPTERKIPTAEELNADLDKYHQDAMQTS